MPEELKDSGAVTALSVIGLVFGLIGMLGSFIPCLGSLAFFVGIPAAVISGIGLGLAYVQNAKRTFAIVALTISMIGVVVSGWQYFSIISLGEKAEQQINKQYNIKNNKTASANFVNNKRYFTESSVGDVYFGNKLRLVEQKVGKSVISGRTGWDDIFFVSFEKYPGIKFRVDNSIVTAAYLTNNDKYRTPYGDIYNGMPISKVKKILNKIDKTRYTYERVINPEPHLIYKIFDDSHSNVIAFYEYEGLGKVDGVGFGMKEYVFSPTD